MSQCSGTVFPTVLYAQAIYGVTTVSNACSRESCAVSPIAYSILPSDSSIHGTNVPKEAELSTQNENAGPSHALHGRILALALLSAVALFMENLDATIIAPGLPSMAHDFGVKPVALNIGITAYLLALAVFIPMSGWLDGRFGERRVFGSAVLILTVASVLRGVSRTLPEFLLSRVLQGLGGSMMVPVGKMMLVRAVSKPQRLDALAYTIWPALTAPILGPVVGGYVLHVASWPWMETIGMVSAHCPHAAGSSHDQEQDHHLYNPGT